MTPIDRLRLQKAASDCGFEMDPTECEGGLELRSARFPETLQVRAVASAEFELQASNQRLLDRPSSDGSITVQGFDALYAALKSVAARARTMPNRVADAFRIEADRLQSVCCGRSPCRAECQQLAGMNGRGRDGDCSPPPAQIRTCGTTAYGSCLES